MEKVVDDVKSGLKGVRGAGDAIRGSAMNMTDQAFDNDQNHPETQASREKHADLAAKGKQDVNAVNDIQKRHESKST